METALVVPVPEAEPIVGSWRWRYASDAAAGMWAHVTIIYPFRESSLIGAEAVSCITRVAASVARFAFTLARVEYFRSPAVVLYLAPEPAAPFEALARNLASEFPDAPPYRGEFEEIVPHVSIADEEDPEILAAIEADVSAHLPILATAKNVQLVEHAPAGWRRRQSFALGSV